MKKAVLFLAVSVLMLMISCGDDQPTKFSEYVFDKRNIKNDTNWVEVTDIDTVDVCIHYEVYSDGKVASSEEQFKGYFLKNLQYNFSGDPIKYSCYFNYTSPDIDFAKRDVILYSTLTGGGFPINTRQLYKNTQSKQYLYLLTIKRTDVTEENSFFDETITIPKIEKGYDITFDTLRFD